MQAIQYRGKTKDHKWVYGYCIISTLGDYIIYENGKFIDVIPETVGHSTSIHDKNGIQDWTSDVVQVYVGRVKYKREIFQSQISGAYCINLPTLGSTSGEEAIMICTIEHQNIGSVFDNPGIFEKKE